MSVCLIVCGIHMCSVCEYVCVWAHMHRSIGLGAIEKRLFLPCVLFLGLITKITPNVHYALWDIFSKVVWSSEYDISEGYYMFINVAPQTL